MTHFEGVHMLSELNSLPRAYLRW